MNGIFPIVGDVILFDFNQKEGLIVCHVVQESLKAEVLLERSFNRKDEIPFNWVVKGKPVLDVFSEEVVTTGSSDLNQILHKIKKIVDCDLESVFIVDKVDEDNGQFFSISFASGKQQKDETIFWRLKDWAKEECTFKKRHDFDKATKELKDFIKKEVFTTKKKRAATGLGFFRCLKK